MTEIILYYGIETYTMRRFKKMRDKRCPKCGGWSIFNPYTGNTLCDNPKCNYIFINEED